jgi:competence protein ComEC
MAILWLVGTWLAGIGLALTYGRAEAAPALLGVAALGLVGLLLTRSRPRWRLGFACLLAATLGGWRMLSYPTKPTADQIGAFNDHGALEFTGIVDDYPDIRDNAIYLRISVQTRVVNGDYSPLSGAILIQTDRFSDYRYGDRLQIKGEPLTPARFDTFSYRDYLARSGIYSVMYRPLVRLIARDQGNPLLALSFKLRERLYHQINAWLPAPQSALFNGILLGLDNDLPASIKQAFQDTGTSHIVAISGANVAVVAGLLLALFGKMRRKWLSTFIIIVGIGWYVCFVGASASVVRAAFAVGLTMVAESTGRRSLGLASLAFTVFVQTAINPYLIVDGSLILSSLGTLGILVYLPMFQKATKKLRQWSINQFNRNLHLPKSSDVKQIALENRSVWGSISLGFGTAILEAVLTTVAAQAVVTPAILVLFERNSLVALPANALIVPFQGPIMELGVIAAALSLVFAPLGQLVAWLAFIPVSYTLAMVRAIGSLPGIAGAVSIEPGMIAAYYVILFGATWYFSRPVDDRKSKIPVLNRLSFPTLSLATAAIAVLVWAIAVSRPDGQLHVWFLDVGDGSAALIQTPNGASILIDGGDNPSRLRTAIGDRLPFYQRTLDLHILTDTRRSNLAAIAPLLDRYQIQTAVTGEPLEGNKATASYQQSFRGEWVLAQDEQTISLSDGVTVQCLRLDDSSPLALLISYQDARFLFAPNLSVDQLDALAGRNLSATVLQVSPYIQSKLAVREVQAFTPQVIVMETEAGTRYPTMSGELLDYLQTQPFYQTGTHGLIHLATDGHQLAIYTGR